MTELKQMIVEAISVTPDTFFLKTIEVEIETSGQVITLDDINEKLVKAS
ncbi:MAG: hypothetical protein ACXAEU_16135 [Candidatus Hodarchaeales archaeon]|jgi:hypothetical protein